MPPRKMRWGRMNPEFFHVMTLLRAISAGPRWAIIKVLGNEEKSTSQIYEELVIKYGMPIPRSLLYYHLASLEAMGIIEMVRYQETGKGGAPEKVWRLKLKRIIIDLSSGNIKIE